MRSFAVITAFSILLLLPAFLLGAGGVDLHCQSLWVRHFSEQFWAGDIYPRWLMDMFAGDGSPDFFYYPPLTYFITALFTKLTPSSAFDYTPIATSALLAVIVSGLTFYAWMKEETASAQAALLGSLIYMSAPNHVAQDFYQVLLFSSVWAYAWMPLLMLFARRLALGRTHSVAGFAVSLALLVMTNLPMTYIFGPFCVAYSLLHFTRAHFKGQAVRLITGIALGFALASISLLPAMLYMDYANIRSHWDNMGPQSIALGKQFFIGFGSDIEKLNTLYMCVSAILVLVYFMACTPKKPRLFYLLFAGAGLFAMLPASQLLWLYFPGLKILQIPERLFALTSLCLAALIALALPRLKWLSWGIVAASVICTIGIAYHTRVTEESFRHDAPLRYQYYQLSINQYPYYLSSKDLIAHYDQHGVDKLKGPRSKWENLNGDAVIDIEHWQPRDIAFHYRASGPSVVRIRQFYFPGFTAFAGSAVIPVGRDDDSGEILLQLPAGEADIALKLAALWPEVAGRLISFLATMVLLLITLMQFRQKHAQAAD